MPDNIINWDLLQNEDETLYLLAREAIAFKDSMFGKYLFGELDYLEGMGSESTIRLTNAGDIDGARSSAALVAGVQEIRNKVFSDIIRQAETLSVSHEEDY